MDVEWEGLRLSSGCPIARCSQQGRPLPNDLSHSWRLRLLLRSRKAEAAASLTAFGCSQRSLPAPGCSVSACSASACSSSAFGLLMSPICLCRFARLPIRRSYVRDTTQWLDEMWREAEQERGLLPVAKLRENSMGKQVVATLRKIQQKAYINSSYTARNKQ